jgi:hypothetical protein
MRLHQAAFQAQVVIEEIPNYFNWKIKKIQTINKLKIDKNKHKVSYLSIGNSYSITLFGSFEAETERCFSILIIGIN